MDEANLEDKLNELVKEFGDAADPQQRKLAQLAQQAHRGAQHMGDEMFSGPDAYIQIGPAGIGIPV